jgi:hypothetical protein
VGSWSSGRAETSAEAMTSRAEGRRAWSRAVMDGQLVTGSYVNSNLKPWQLALNSALSRCCADSLVPSPTSDPDQPRVGRIEDTVWLHGRMREVPRKSNPQFLYFEWRDQLYSSEDAFCHKMREERLRTD